MAAPHPTGEPSADAAEAERASGAEPRVSLVREFIGYLREDKKWWLVPLVLMFGLLMLLMVATGKAAVLAPFLYTLF